MRNLVLGMSLTLSVLLFSCGGAEEAKTEEKVVETKKLPCTYAYANENTMVTWTAYKLTEKAGVNGSFEKFTVSGTSENEDPNLALTGAQFVIETSSTQTQDTARNGKIYRNFFKPLKCETITGTVKSFSEDGTTCTITIRMNEMDKDVTANVKWEEETVTVSAEINLEDWNGQEAMKSLNKVCKEKHTGADGISKLWPDVSLVVKTTLVKTCPE